MSSSAAVFHRIKCLCALCLMSTIGRLRPIPVCSRLIFNCGPIPEIEADESSGHDEKTAPGKRKVGKMADKDQVRKKKKRKKMVCIHE